MLRIGVLLSLVVLAACPPAEPPPPGSCDEPLFGRPVPQTGLDETRCKTTCTWCGDGGYTAPEFDAARLASLRAWTNTVPFAELPSDPYREDAGVADERAVCAVVVEDAAGKTYHVETFASVEAAANAGATLTHFNPCGVCSTLQDLAVYAEQNDIGKPMQKCGVDNFGRPVADLVACVERMGMTKPCAQAWAYNSRFTQEKCIDVCFAQLDAPHHQRDGKLNTCLACEQRLSGPTFKVVAGRTRRNTGLAASVCLPCSDVRPVNHEY